MRTNTDRTLKHLPTAEVEQLLTNVESILFYETFGNDQEAYCDKMQERSKLIKELKQRGVY